MRSAKRTQTYWRAGCRGAAAGRRARGRHWPARARLRASDDADAAAASPPTPLHILPDSHFSTILTASNLHRVNPRPSTLEHGRRFDSYFFSFEGLFAATEFAK